MRRACWCVGLLLVGCSSRSCASSSSEPPDTATAPLASQAGAATLAARVRAIEDGTHGDACEARVRATRRRIAEAVDRAWQQIEARVASLAPAPPYTRVRLGPTYVRARDTDAGAAAPGWTARDRSWELLGAALGSLGTAIDEGWVTLAREALALLVFDTARIVAGGWHDSTAPALEPPRVAPNLAVKREGGALVVPLDAGPFEADKAKLAQAIESVWTSEQLSVRVRWTSQTTEPDAYRFALGTVTGEPSRVSEKRREVWLSPDVRSHAIAHEIGHVLGLADRYARRWDVIRCVYVSEIDPGDIMSEPDGPVTAEEWRLLAAAYAR